MHRGAGRRNPDVWNNADMRHNKGLNVLHVDGHAALIPVAEWTKKEHWAWEFN